MIDSSTSNPRVVVSAIIEKVEDGMWFVFMQTRWKPQASPTYLGVFEIPAGGIDGYENVYDSVKREVKEETGLEIIRFIDDFQTPVTYARLGDSSIAFRPFICQQVLETNGGLPWVGFVFRCEATGTISMQTSEAKDPRWVSIDELDELLNKSPEKIFSLHVATLKYYVDFVRNLTRSL
ncbi:NUDIX domain-containing protein [Candidatus Saccharibacteria bacterium]|nr:MAG: NUDIX domain-containing protein [Candidatus Saccharibacteria bacterium]